MNVTPQNSCLNRTKSCSMYEVRGRIVALFGFITVIFLVFYVMSPSSDISVMSFNQNPQNMNPQFNNINPRMEEKKRKGKLGDIYAVVFDAGSTGSRVHVFHFRSSNGPLKLVNEVFKQVKPGLSSYANDPKKGAESLRQLLNIALADVPSELQTKTPISLMATAGLRLLPEGVADNLLNEAKELFKDYPFHLPNDGISIMDGTEEGIFSWLTISFLTGDFSEGRNNVAALDMGGGSTQITFVPYKEDIFSSVPKDFSETINLLNKKLKLYTHSYLGYGLMATRYKMLGGDKHKGNKEVLHSECLPHNITSAWSYGGKVYNVTGELTSSFNNCYIHLKNFVSEKIYKVYELQKHKIFIFSYFYDAAMDAGLIDSSIGGEVTVADFRRAAKKAFDHPSIKKPFLGLDLLYMYSLLYDGYRLRSKTQLNIVKKLEHVEVSWGLGAAFDLLSSTGFIR